MKIVIPAGVLPSARNISFHTLDTFPEKRYGFVDLPQMDADKLKRKLNGTTLKGAKMRIEKARPEVRVEPTGDPDCAEKKTKKRKSKDDPESLKRRKRDYNLVDGVVLKDRKVKRGWTESTDTKRKIRKSKDKSSKDKDKDKDKRKRLKSKYTEQDECLLKTTLPANMVGNLPGAEAYKKKKKNGNSREMTVHEFEKTTKFPSFLKHSAPETNGKPATEFVEGKGWVDEDGNVVEVVKHKEVPTTTPKRKISVKKAALQEESDDDDTSSSGTSSEEEDSDSDESEIADADETSVEVDVRALEKYSNSSLEDEANASRDSSSEEQENKATPPSTKADDSRPISSSSSKSLAIKIPPPPTTPSAAKVHPLEALYKRAKPSDTSTAQNPAQESQPFSFFGGGDAENDDDDDNDVEDQDEPATAAAAAAVPMTPYTRQDFEWRNIRSAAPTPDTAHPSRMRNFWAPQGEDDAEIDDDAVAEEEEEQEDDEEGRQTAQGQAGASDFQSWFWENRRDLNQSWMTRRKSAAKEKRHRENKARASKAI